AFTVAWSYWISTWVGNAAIAAAAISYLSLFVPALTATPAATAAAAVGLLWLLTLLNCFSLRAAGGFQLVTVLIKLVPLLVVIGLASYVVATGRQGPIVPLRTQDLHISSINAAATLTLWALLGVEAPSIACRA